MRVFVYNRIIIDAIMEHSLMQKERQREHDNVEFVGTLPKAPWSENVVAVLRDRAQAQETLLGTTRRTADRR
jgi:hypothetical protein